ncbi:MAG: dihydrofolate reductase [Bacteroidales bacterium]|nr:dihydrofolate reductase [Candidatus Cryptobacteroides choladohippi]
MEKCLIVAIGANNEIGVKGTLPWHLSEDLKYFKRVTSGCPVIMGRTTYFSLPFRPLKNRKNIVLNAGGDPIPEATCVYSFEEAYAAAGPAEKCFVMGGASVYRAAVNDMDRLYITHVHASIPEADAFFPAIDPEIWKVESRSAVYKDKECGYEFQFFVYTRK